MGDKSSSAPPPDPRLVDAQIRSLDAQERLANQSYQRIEELSPLVKSSMEHSLAAGKVAEERGNIIFDQSQADRVHTLERRDRLTEIQNQVLADNANFNQGAYRERLLGEATTDINSAFKQAQDIQTREMARRNVNLSSGAAAMMRNQSTLNQALALSKAARDVSEAARLEGYRLGDRALGALNGNQQLAMQATSAGMGMAQGSYALASTGQGVVGTGLNTYNSGYSAAAGMYGNMGTTATNAFNAQANYKNAQDKLAAESDPTGEILGMAARGMMSDRRVKDNIRRVGTLDNGLPVYTFTYKDDPRGTTVMGVMADEVEKVVPEAVIKQADGHFDAVDYSKLGGAA